jgi:hypothetical protein
LEAVLGEGKTLEIDVAALECAFAKPVVKPRAGSTADGAAEADGSTKMRATKVCLLEPKRSTGVGIVMKRITDGLQQKELREALMEVDENLLPLEVLPMVSEIVPTAEEAKMLLGYSGELAALDRPEQLMRTLATVPRLEARLKAMTFKSQLEIDMDGLLMQQVDDLRSACRAVRDCRELHALFQIVLDIGNALNAGTAKGDAVGFKVTTLLKLAELKAADKKSTLLHFVVDVVRKNAPQVTAAVVGLAPCVRDAARVSLEELTLKKAEAERELEHVGGGHFYIGRRALLHRTAGTFT